MLVSYRWLQDYVEIDLDPAQLAEGLTAIGLKVEGISHTEPRFSGVVVGKIVELQRHQASDHLWVAVVEIGRVDGSGLGGRLVLVTGATNIKVGDRVPVALPGAVLPEKDGTSRVIRTLEFQGVISQGMLCSEAELAVGEDASGIMILPPDAPVGKSVAEVLGLDDTVIDLEIYANRADLWSMLGVAREVAAWLGRPLRRPEPRLAVARARGGREGNLPINVEVQATDLCPRYLATLALGLEIGPSPLWMAQRLRAAGMRPINNVVDITNFVMLETGQPLHAFDLRDVRQQTILVRRAEAGERFRTLDEKEHELSPDILVIADPERAIALAGIMGGENSEIRLDTRDVLLESATFHAATVRRGALRLGLRTEASSRFEKGLDPNLPAYAAARALELFADIAKATIPAGWVDHYPAPVEPWKVRFRPHKVNALLGSDIPVAEMKRLLARLEITLEPSSSTGGGASPAEEEYQAVIPTFRQDVTREADLAEEVIRFWGYDRLPETAPRGPVVAGRQSPRLDLADKIRGLLVSQGVSEVITYSFTSPRHFDRLRLAADHPWRQAIPILNPLSEERSIMRTSLLPGLLEVAARNAARQQAVWIFEVGAVYIPDELPLRQQPREPLHLGVLLLGSADQAAGAVDWTRRLPVADVYDLKGMLEQLFERLLIGVEFLPVGDGDERERLPFLHPGRAAVIWSAAGRWLGYLGELHPEVIRGYDLPGRPVVAEIDVEEVLQLPVTVPRHQPLPEFPAVFRDLALLVPKDVPAREVERRLWESGGQLLRSLRLFDVYEGKQIPAGMRSLAYALEFRSDTGTLREDEVESVLERITAALASLGVSVRG
ncbi:MAG: phenylalanine--tRNA ligase subunit beta [Limnochordales bacterium]|nr:phenylalanine--tRNA ligase subunit beta [Limnochordales bacterium]